MKKTMKGKWAKANIVTTQIGEIQKIIKNDDLFANVSQFVMFAVRKEIDSRKRVLKRVNGKIPKSEKQIKVKLEKWMHDIRKEIELDEKLRQAFKNSKSHTKILSK